MSAEILYGSNSDVREEISGGSVRGEPGYFDESQVRESIITRSVRRATRRVNGKLKKTFPNEIPFAASGDCPALIRSVTSDLAVYYVKRSTHPGPGPLSSEVKSEYWDKPMEALDEIIDAGIKLSELDSKGSTISDRVFDNREDKTPVFDMDDIVNQGVDPDLLDDISDDRD